jgi:hypothetical protein
MRPEIRWASAAAAALGMGVVIATPYARLAAPFYAWIARAVAREHPWQVMSVDVRPGTSGLSAELQLEGYVRRHAEDLKPAARVIGRVQVGEVIETPVLFWTLLLLWPATGLRQRAARMTVGIPIYLALEAVTTAAQLMLPLAQASAILAGEDDPATTWDYWSRFLEAGGQFAVVWIGAMLVAVSTGGAAIVPPGARSPGSTTPDQPHRRRRCCCWTWPLSPSR